MAPEKMTHTPGPRHIVKNVDHHGLEGEDALTITWEDRSGKHPVRFIKTYRARLIAAAPDQNAELRAIKTWMEDCLLDRQERGLPSRERYESVCAVLAKAEAH